MDIEGIGESSVEVLVQQNLINNIADLYNVLDPEKQRILNKIPGF